MSYYLFYNILRPLQTKRPQSSLYYACKRPKYNAPSDNLGKIQVGLIIAGGGFVSESAVSTAQVCD